MFRPLLTLLLLISMSTFVSAQAKDEANNEKAAKSQTEAVAFLRETIAEVGNLRALENRISFASELANMMWPIDEREAKAMYSALLIDFRNLLVKYDSQMNALPLSVTNNDDDHMGGMLGDDEERSKISGKFRIALIVRQGIAMNLAQRDPDAALSFYYDSAAVITNPELASQVQGVKDGFEQKLLIMAVNSGSPNAIKLSKRSLDGGFKQNHVNILEGLYQKDAEKAAEFGAAILSRIKVQTFEGSDFYALDQLLHFGERTLSDARRSSKTPLYTLADLREIADIFGKALLEAKNGNSYGLAFAGDIGKYSPGRAAEIRARVPKGTKSAYQRSGNATVDSHAVEGGVPGNSAVNVAARAALPAIDINSPEDTENEAVDESANIANTSSVANYAARRDAEEKRERAIASLSGSEISPDDRQKIIVAARAEIAALPNRSVKVAKLIELATQISAGGDKTLASSLMNEAASLVNPNPKNVSEFTSTWSLIAGYARIEPEKAFPILDDTIMRANTLIDAFVKVGEFLDPTSTMIDEGEVLLGAFSGGMGASGLPLSQLDDAVVSNLLKADFSRTRDLTNRFDRAEIRVMAKMLVLKTVLTDEAAAKVKKGDGLK